MNEVYSNSPKPSNYVAFCLAWHPRARQNHKRVQRKVMNHLQVLEKMV